MINKLIRLSLILGIQLLLLSTVALAQDQMLASNTAPSSSSPTANQALSSLLSALPDADTLIYVSPQRIFSDAAPKVVPEAEIVKMRQQFDNLKQSVGIDPAKLDYVVVALRFRKPAADLSFQMPEFMIVTSGDFSADSLLTTARSIMPPEKVIDEKYGSKTLTLVTIEDLAKEAEKTPFLKSFSQMALVALNTNTLAAGNISYLKAAVDAADGRERINPETLNSLTRDPNALISMAGSPWASFAKSIGLVGTETTPRTPRCETRLGDFYAAITQEGTNFRLRGAMNADNPDTAKIIGGLLGMIMKTVPEDSNAKSFPSMLKRVNINTTETEVIVQADFPQQMVADFISEQMKPKPPAETSATKAPAPKPVKKRRVTRKRQ